MSAVIDHLQASCTATLALRINPTYAGQVERIVDLLVECLGEASKVMLCGNGGSAADAQHVAAELTGRYRRDRTPLAAVALTTDTSALTAIGNDYGFDQVFARQLRALARAGDVLVVLSTSGSSDNVLRAAEAARELGLTVIGLTGSSGGDLVDLCDVIVRVPSADAPVVQQLHAIVGHAICAGVEERLFG